MRHYDTTTAEQVRANSIGALIAIAFAVTVAAVLFAGWFARAADMTKAAPLQRPAPVVAGDPWTGFYVFGFGGYSVSKMTPDDFDVGTLVEGFHNPKPKGTVYGFGGGYNWQSGRFVGGLEVDYGFSQAKDDQSLTSDIGDGKVVSTTLALKSKIDALGSARIRAGFLLGDSFLVYGTGGLGFARSQATISQTFTAGTESETLSASARANNFGWVAGAGIEWAVMQHIRIRAEVLHYDFGSTAYAFQTPFVLGVNVNSKLTTDVARGALIWSF